MYGTFSETSRTACHFLWRLVVRRRTALTAACFLLALWAFRASAVPAQTSADNQALPERAASAVPFQLERPAGPILVRGGDRADPVDHAVEEYRRTGTARTVRQSSYVAYPFGHSQPTLTCAPLRACVIELEEGEALIDFVAGDTERWLLKETYTGTGGATPLLIVKPTDFDLTTNLVISTDRRIYELTLDAPPPRRASRGAKNPQELYTRRIRFYYPDAAARSAEERQALQRRLAASTTPITNPDFRLENLNFDYRWSASKRFPFTLEQVFDDGAHTYLKVPSSARYEAAPVLFAVEGGERQIVNYTVRAAGEHHQYYITDRVLRQGTLVLGTTRKNWLGRAKHAEERLTLVNLAR